MPLIIQKIPEMYRSALKKIEWPVLTISQHGVKISNSQGEEGLGIFFCYVITRRFLIKIRERFIHVFFTLCNNIFI